MPRILLKYLKDRPYTKAVNCTDLNDCNSGMEQIEDLFKIFGQVSTLVNRMLKLQQKKQMFLSLTTEMGLFSSDYKCPNCGEYESSVTHTVDGEKYPIIADETVVFSHDIGADIPAWNEIQRCSNCKTKYHYINHA